MTANRRILATATALSGLVLLTACGGGGGGATPPDPQSFSGPNDSMATRISNARTSDQATAFTAMAVGIDYVDGGAAPVDPEEISVKIYRTGPNAVPTVELTRGDDVMTFGPEHAPDGGNYRVPRSAEDAQDNRDLWMWAGYPIRHADGWYVNDEGERRAQSRRHLIPLGFWINTEEADPLRNAVIGLHTSPADMPTHSIPAFYEGWAFLESWQVDNGANRSRFRGELRLEADFDGGTISGTLHDVHEEVIRGDDESGYQPREGLAFVIPETAIDGNGFAGTLEASDGCVGCPQDMSATVNGGFYGPYARESGGTIQGSFTRGGVDEVAAGIFYSNQR